NLGLSTLEQREVIDARLMIERWSAARAAATGAGTEALAAAIEGMDRAGSAEEFVEHDTAFHCAIADASGNRLIAAVMRSLRDAMRRNSVEAVERLGDTSGLRADHERIRAAIAAGAADEAERAVSDHLAHAYPALFPDH
ncbi:MAG: FCD domain-containing protein, partial [Nonomuraea sp.]|nr:FCD domain-containing protein [Nonomuraea sp.]